MKEFFSKRNVQLFILASIVPMKLFATGLGSQSWGDSSDLGAGGGSMSLLNALFPIGLYCLCFWLAFSEKSPFSDKGFLWQMAIFLFGPSLLIALITSLMK